MSGVDITTVSRLLGHKSLSMTLRYSHLAPSHMVKAVDMLDTVLNGKPISTVEREFIEIFRDISFFESKFYSIEI
jgi:site-specific recombinase XerC